VSRASFTSQAPVEGCSIAVLWRVLPFYRSSEFVADTGNAVVIDVSFESNIGNVAVIVADSQSIVEFTDGRFIGNQGTHYYQCP